MARRRMISAELISDPEYNSLSIEAQNIFVRMLSISDDCGIVPANSYRLNTLINTPVEYKDQIQEIIDEMVFRNLGSRFIYRQEDFFAFKKKSFEDYQSYILKKATKSEYLRIPKKDLDSSEIKSEKSPSAHIPISVRRFFAESVGLDVGNVMESKPIGCKKCLKIGKIKNNGRGWITLDGLNFDHIIPHRFNGGYEIENFQILCPSCNQKKKYVDIDKYEKIPEVLENSRNSFGISESAVSTVASKEHKVESKEQRASGKGLEQYLLQTWGGKDGKLANIHLQQLVKFGDEQGYDRVFYAIEQGAKYNHKSFAYIEKILLNKDGKKKGEFVDTISNTPDYIEWKKRHNR